MEETKNLLLSSTANKYSGNIWLCNYRIIINLIGVVFCVVILWGKGVEHPILFAISIFAAIVFIYMAQSLQMNYFIIDRQMLIVKNHFNTDELTVMAMEDIADLEIGSMPKGPKALKVILKNGKKEIFPATSLRKKNWEELKKGLAASNLPVKDNGVVFYNQ